MRAKLEELQNDLITIENYDFGESLSLLQLSMAECHNLCPRCMDMFYNEKLLMHSDLDMAFAKLDMHTKKINEIYKTR